MNLLFNLGIRRIKILRAKLVLIGILIIILYCYLLGEMTKPTHQIPIKQDAPTKELRIGV